MNCSRCNQPLDPGATFCGNCGQPVGFAAVPADSALPAPAPATQAGEMKAALALIFGITGIIGAGFIPIIGLVFGIAGIILGTLSRAVFKRKLALVGIVFASLAILAGLASWVYVLNKPVSGSEHKDLTKTTAPAALTSTLATPCYTASLIEKFNVNNEAGNCDMVAYNGTAVEASTDLYKVYANTSDISDPAEFTKVAKDALEKDIKTTLPGFTLDTERTGSFAGSPAYTVQASSKDQGIAVVETAVLHKTAKGDNVFILVHAVNDSTADLQILEAQWQWK